MHGACVCSRACMCTAVLYVAVAVSLYNEWVETYQNLTIINIINTRNKNIKFLLLSFYSLFPPLKNEGLNLKIADSHEKAKKLEYTIHTRDENNIWVYLNKSIKFHKPIHFISLYNR